MTKSTKPPVTPTCYPTSYICGSCGGSMRFSDDAHNFQIPHIITCSNPECPTWGSNFKVTPLEMKEIK